MSSTKCKLSINIPTYNRLRYLKRTLELLEPQVTPEVEINVLDNGSQDGTWDFLLSRFPEAHRFSQGENRGVDVNVISALTFGRGEYVWILGDDDVPKADCVDHILRMIDRHHGPPLFFLRTQWVYDPETFAGTGIGEARWSCKSANEFLSDVSIFFTAVSSIVVKRDAVDAEVIRRYIGSVLTPAAIVLEAAFREDRVFVSDDPLIVCRSGNDSSYDGITAFTRNMNRLFRDFRAKGLQQNIIRRVNGDSLRNVLPYVIRVMKVTPINLFRLGMFALPYPSAYSALGKALIRKAVKSITPVWLRQKIGLTLDQP